MTIFCGSSDVKEWGARVDFVHTLIGQRHTTLANMDAGTPENLETLFAQYNATWGELPTVDSGWSYAFGQSDAASVVGEYIANIRQGTCVLELIEAKIKAGGGIPISTGGTIAKDPSSIPGWVWIAIAAGAAWLLFL